MPLTHAFAPNHAATQDNAELAFRLPFLRAMLGAVASMQLSRNPCLALPLPTFKEGIIFYPLHKSPRILVVARAYGKAQVENGGESCAVAAVFLIGQDATRFFQASSAGP